MLSAYFLLHCNTLYKTLGFHHDPLYQTLDSMLQCSEALSNVLQTFTVKQSEKRYLCIVIFPVLIETAIFYLTDPLSTPIPKLHVAAITGTSPDVHLFCTSLRSWFFNPTAEKKLHLETISIARYKTQGNVNSYQHGMQE